MKKIPSLRLLLSILALAAVPAFGVTRNIAIKAPAAVTAGSGVKVTVTATTDANDSEHVGFLHAEFSVDGGKNWTPVYWDNLARSVQKSFDFTAGPGGSTAIVRLRVAFRGGKAGDVDFAGKPIAWDGSWGKWTEPPARQVTIMVSR